MVCLFICSNIVLCSLINFYSIFNVSLWLKVFLSICFYCYCEWNFFPCIFHLPVDTVTWSGLPKASSPYLHSELPIQASHTRRGWLQKQSYTNSRGNSLYLGNMVLFQLTKISKSLKTSACFA